MKLTEVETSYEYYKERTETEIIKLKEKLRIAEENKETEDELRSQIFFLKFAISTKDEEIAKIHKKHSEENSVLKEEVNHLSSEMEVKDHLLRELEQEIERIWLHIDHMDDAPKEDLNTSLELESINTIFKKMKSEVD